ncbi:MAG: N-acetylmuramoyl-L-alanine amidase [Planctomycetota bacterium JB042]
MSSSIVLVAGLALSSPSGGVEGAVVERVGGVVAAPGEVVERTFEAPFPAHAVGLWWGGALGAARLSLAAEGEAAFPYPVVEDHDQAPEVVGTDRPAGALRVGALVVHPDGAGTTARLTVVGPARVDDLRVVWIAADGPVAALAGPDVTHVGSYPKPPVYSRSFWGADPPVCSPTYCATTHLAVHHSASASHWSSTTLAQCAANVKGMQVYHMVTNGWCDLGYHYVVCRHGDIFEGRAGGDDVKGAHDGFNCGSMGVCAMGYFHPPHGHVPTAAMFDALAELFAWKAAQQGIDPLGSSFYAGYGGVVTNVYGHGDVKATACPGDQWFSQLPALRLAVDGKLNPGCPTPTKYGTPQVSSTFQVVDIHWAGSPSFTTNDFVLTGAGFKPASFGWLVAGGGIGNDVQPFGTILVAGPGYTRTLAGTTGAAGGIALSWPIAAPMVGATHHFQWVVRDPGWGGNLTLSQGLAVTYCP